MLLLVLADNFLRRVRRPGSWSACRSYLLIGFWYRKRSAALAAKKAFIVNRVGDVGFALGIMLDLRQPRARSTSATVDRRGSATLDRRADDR